MSIKIGSTDISAVCDKIYVGSDEVYSSAPTKWTWNDFKNFISTHRTQPTTNLTNAVTWFNNNVSTIEQKMASFNFNPNEYNNFILNPDGTYYNIQFFNLESHNYSCDNTARINYTNADTTPAKIFAYRVNYAIWPSQMTNYYAGGVSTGLMEKKPLNNYYGNVVIETL